MSPCFHASLRVNVGSRRVCVDAVTQEESALGPRALISGTSQRELTLSGVSMTTNNRRGPSFLFWLPENKVNKNGGVTIPPPHVMSREGRSERRSKVFIWTLLSVWTQVFDGKCLDLLEIFWSQERSRRGWKLKWYALMLTVLLRSSAALCDNNSWCWWRIWPVSGTTVPPQVSSVTLKLVMVSICTTICSVIYWCTNHWAWQHLEPGRISQVILHGLISLHDSN